MTPDRSSRQLWLVPILIAALIVAFVLGDEQDPRPSGSTAPGSVRQEQDATGEELGRTITASPARGRRSSVPVPGGRYAIGSDQGGFDEQPVHTVRLAPFRIGRFEVTNAEFARYLNGLDVQPRSDADAGEVGADSFRAEDARLFLEGDEGEQQRPLIALDDEHARIAIREGFVAAAGWTEHPVTESTWEGARRYAAWVGGRLPTEAEWEAAARGRQERTYPWGDESPTLRRAVFGRDSGQTLPVGSRPAGATPQGVHDLAGNVDEWTSSLYRAYPYRLSDGRERVRSTSERVTRGGNHVYSSPNELRSAYRAGFSREPDRGHRHIGFRVAYPPGRR